MDDLFQLLCLAVSLLALPAIYVVCCLKMKAQDLNKAPYLSAFILFGNAGGWVLALALPPLGLAAICVVFLMFIAFPALVVSTIILGFRKDRSPHQQMIMVGGLIFPVGLGFMALLAMLTSPTPYH